MSEKKRVDWLKSNSTVDIINKFCRFSNKYIINYEYKVRSCKGLVNKWGKKSLGDKHQWTKKKKWDNAEVGWRKLGWWKAKKKKKFRDKFDSSINFLFHFFIVIQILRLIKKYNKLFDLKERYCTGIQTSVLIFIITKNRKPIFPLKILWIIRYTSQHRKMHRNQTIGDTLSIFHAQFNFFNFI